VRFLNSVFYQWLYQVTRAEFRLSQNASDRRRAWRDWGRPMLKSDRRLAQAPLQLNIEVIT